MSNINSYALAALLTLGPTAFAAPPALLVSTGAMPAAGGSQPTQPPDAQPVAFNARAALALPIGGTASLTLPRLGTLAVVHDRDEAHPNGDITWVGHFAAYGTDYRVLITFGPKGVAGRIATPDGDFSLLPGNGGAWLRDEQAAGAQPFMQPDNDAPVPPAATKPAGQPATGAAAPAAPAGTPPPQSTVDLMLVYTPNAVALFGDGLQTHLNNLVAITN
jgi:hypothetical protein